MKLKPFVLMIVVGFSVTLAAEAYYEPRLPLTENWFEIAGMNLPGFRSFRKYSIIIDKPNEFIRNTIIFDCSLTEHDKSYVNFIIPKEIVLEKIFGVNYIEKKTFNIEIVTRDGLRRSYYLDGEVNNNEVFFDDNDLNHGGIVDIVRAADINLVLVEDEVSIQFLHLGGRHLPWDGKKVSLDEFIKLQIDLDSKTSKMSSSASVIRQCFDEG